MCIFQFPTNKNHLSFQTTAFHPVKKVCSYKKFNDAELKILWDQFDKDSYISQSEAWHLAKFMNVEPDKIFNWFQRQRSRYTLRGIQRDRGETFLATYMYTYLYIFCQYISFKSLHSFGFHRILINFVILLLWSHIAKIHIL